MLLATRVPPPSFASRYPSARSCSYAVTTVPRDTRRSTASRRVDGRLAPGIYERFAFGFGSAVRPVLLFVSHATYRKRLGFREAVAATFEQRFAANFDDALAKAISTAKQG